MSKISVIGIGPGSKEDMTPAAVEAIVASDVVVSYKYYMQFVKPLLKEGTKLVDTGMKQERERVAIALAEAEKGLNVAIISSGDSGIYGMAPLVMEMKHKCSIDIEVEVIPGISAFQKAAALLGSPASHDFCIISMSDLMTPWGVIEKRIKAAVDADFVTAVYNPKSRERYWQLYRLQELFVEGRDAGTPVGIVRQAGRPEQQVTVTTLQDFDPEDVDMFTIVIIGNSQSYISDGKIITPRGYYNSSENESFGVGSGIMMESFRTIEKELANPDIPLYKKWPLLHAIHTTADFEMEKLLKVDEDAPQKIYELLSSGKVKTIITDVTMAASGIRKAAIERMGIEVKCYLHDSRTMQISKDKEITRTQAGIDLAVEEHPDALFVFGNAPTALLELSRLINLGKVHPAGIVAAPVGFVHVCESKHSVKPFKEIPKIIVDGRKGGSNLAATLVNSILAWPDAAQLKPGRDV